MSGEKEKTSVNSGASLEELLAETTKDDQREESELYVAKLHIRKSRKVTIFEPWVRVYRCI